MIILLVDLLYHALTAFGVLFCCHVIDNSLEVIMEACRRQRTSSQNSAEPMVNQVRCRTWCRCVRQLFISLLCRSLPIAAELACHSRRQPHDGNARMSKPLMPWPSDRCVLNDLFIRALEDARAAGNLPTNGRYAMPFSFRSFAAES